MFWSESFCHEHAFAAKLDIPRQYTLSLIVTAKKA
jgi:hypothetical protein